MCRRLKVLLSAYACEPNKGSEPEVGWQWAMQMARFHDVMVLTRVNNRASIEAAIKGMPSGTPVPRFYYFDRSQVLTDLKRRTRSTKLYYLLWQRAAYEVVKRLHELHQFDVMHHVTFAAFRYPTAVWGHGAPVVWGPVGGIESIPAGLLPWKHPISLAHEMARNLSNVLQAAPYQVLPKRAEASTVILASTTEMNALFSKLGVNSRVMPTIGLAASEVPPASRRETSGPLRILFVGNIITLKGIDLAIEAVADCGNGARFTIIGSGNYERAARRQVQARGLSSFVTLAGRKPREEVLKLYRDYDLFLFPSLHDTGGYAVIEAMANEMPVICVDCGGPAVAVSADCGMKIALGGRKQIVKDLSKAIKTYDRDRSLLLKHGMKARQRVLENYEWSRKGEQMSAIYKKAVEIQAQASKRKARTAYSGMGGLTNLLHRFFSFRGAAATVLGLLLVGMVGFISIGHLKKQANQIVQDTLPGLSYSGEANSALAQAFNRTLLYLLTDDPAQRNEYREQIDSFTASTTTYLKKYESDIFTDEDRKNYEAMIRARNAYSLIRGEAVALADAHRGPEAARLLHNKLIPAYQEYKEAANRLFEYNMREGQVRGESIMRLCTITQFVVAFIGVLIFVIGFFLGVAR
jgi:glycosyltransferase involved in cell wall biosynthesis